MESVDTTGTVSELLSPFYVLYDLRVAYLHLLSNDKTKEMLDTVTSRLKLPNNSGLLTIYERLTRDLAVSYSKLMVILKQGPI